MNAMTKFALAPPSSMLSRLDCSSEENVKDALHQLRRCRTEADYANWAAAWGENLCRRAEEMAGMNEGDDAALAEAEGEAERAEKNLAELRDVVEGAVRELDAAGEGPADRFAARVEAVTSKLENAL